MVDVWYAVSSWNSSERMSIVREPHTAFVEESTWDAYIVPLEVN